MTSAFIETHAHYNLPAFEDDLDEVLAEVREYLELVLLLGIAVA